MVAPASVTQRKWTSAGFKPSTHNTSSSNSRVCRHTLSFKRTALAGAKMFLRLFITMLAVILAWTTVADVVAEDNRVAGAFLSRDAL